MSTYEDVPMFDVEPIKVRTPKRPRSKGKPVWTHYRPKDPQKCDDCKLLLFKTKGNAPASLPARYRRTVDGASLLLCPAHAAARREEDGLPTSLKENGS